MTNLGAIAAVLVAFNVEVTSTQTTQDNPAAHKLGSEAAKKSLVSAIARVAEPCSAVWKVELDEEVVTRHDAKEEIVGRVRGELSASPEGYLVEVRDGAQGAKGTISLSQQTVFVRNGDGFSIREEPPLVLWTLPFIAPTEASMRQISLSRPDLWHEVVESDTALSTSFVVSIAPRGNIIREEYRLEFAKSESVLLFTGYSWKIWTAGAREGSPSLVLNIEVTASDWIEIDGHRIPKLVTRSARQLSSEGNIDVDSIQRLRATPMGSVDPGTVQVAMLAASRPRIGEMVRDSVHGAEYRIGEAWIKVGGVEIQLDQPIQGIPESIPELLRKAGALKK